MGYRPATVMSNVEDTSFSESSRDVTHVLTKVMILHPIATGIAFLAFVFGLGAGFFGSLLAALTSLLAFIVTVVALICDFVLFAIIKHDVNNDGSGSRADYSAGIWTILVAAICSLLGAIVVFFTCCSGRMHRRRDAAVTKNDYGTTTTRRRRWF